VSVCAGTRNCEQWGVLRTVGASMPEVVSRSPGKQLLRKSSIAEGFLVSLVRMGFRL
jgi:hypothetical protein